MCGIAGIIYKNSAAEVDKQLLTAMTRSMAHRGPDDEGYFIRGNLGLGHRRLSIIDLPGGHQPVLNEDNTVAVIFNGEIYNYRELTEELKEQGHTFSTRTDTETIVHAFEEYGPGCVQKLRGMFAFALWDTNKNKLFLARDRVGEKPLYYYSDDHVFIFASEIKALFATNLLRPEVNVPLVDCYLSLGYVPGPETLFKGIQKLQPGHILVLDGSGDPQIDRYWDIEKIDTIDWSFSDAVARLDELLLESVRMRLMSDVPLGVFLSGGIDSTTIVSMMSRLTTGPIKTFSLGYTDEIQSSELPFADMVAKEFHTDHHRFCLTADHLLESIDTLLHHMEEPVAESPAIALFKLATLARPHATVLLCGEGADELFAGYPMYARMLRIHKMSKLPLAINPTIWGWIAGLASTREKTAKYAGWLGQPFPSRFRSLSYDLADSTKRRMYQSGFLELARGHVEKHFADLHERVESKSMLARMLYIDTKTWLPDDLLIKADKMTMAASIELRTPFLDHTLMEFAASLPDAFKVNGTTGKYILRECMKDKIPKEVLIRKKRGFPIPVTPWFRGPLHDRAKDLLLSDRAVSRGYIRSAYVSDLFDRIRRGEDLGRRLFSLVVLELWHRKYIDSAPTRYLPN